MNEEEKRETLEGHTLKCQLWLVELQVVFTLYRSCVACNCLGVLQLVLITLIRIYSTSLNTSYTEEGQQAESPAAVTQGAL